MGDASPQSRRRFLQTGTLGACGAAIGTAAATTQAQATNGDSPAKVRCDELLPHEFRTRLAERAIAYLPLGTLEWHGEHIALGADAIQSESLMCECARRFGGIVMPPIHLGPDRAKTADDGTMLIGMDYADSTTPPRQLDGSCYWVPPGLHDMIVDAILTQLKRAGFKAVFADGHGPSRWAWVANLAEREARFGLRLFGVTKNISADWKSQVDHAAKNETSLMMHYRPELVDLNRLPESRDVRPQGVGGADPRDASAAFGKECMEESIALVRKLFDDAGLL
ncbi:MAG: creatininase family protein [Planctomycetaceae bacterium]|nr:creatininase family protein [Planctomycetaceae bacterium]